MTNVSLTTILDGLAGGIVLLEGTRSLTEEDQPRVRQFAVLLANRYPHLVFRSGNVDGTDETFADGVCSVDPSRMAYVLPAEGHRRKARHPGTRAVSLDDVPPERLVQLACQTNRATPANSRLIDRYIQGHRLGRAGHQAKYLLRDTLKVTGAPEFGLAPGVVGIFHVNPKDPMGGGTGHTIRVCQQSGVPVFTQTQWQSVFVGAEP
jgi:hypothetical protein